ncbi:hypothetical protein Goshw_026630 [Gossypium schwendimanii]|uniref:Uncharacterized protein n=1 Tax=Gossypium schwendimanii TaxID=34291 RepID=A0A7J9NER4_GOSSC|nr:hypothetical protein [Gossypium schwendimanii]
MDNYKPVYKTKKEEKEKPKYGRQPYVVKTVPKREEKPYYGTKPKPQNLFTFTLRIPIDQYLISVGSWTAMQHGTSSQLLSRSAAAKQVKCNHLAQQHYLVRKAEAGPNEAIKFGCFVLM